MRPRERDCCCCRTLPVALGMYEEFSGNPDGITAVRTTTVLQSRGGYRVKAEYLKNGVPTGGREIRYVEDPDARVIFK